MYKSLILFISILFILNGCGEKDKGIVRITADKTDVKIYNDNELIAMLGDDTADLELTTGNYNIVLKKEIDEDREYYASKEIFVGKDSITRVSFNMQMKLTQKGKEKEIKHNGLVYFPIKSPYTGKIWLDRNLGAQRVCTSSNDEKCFGDYFQWGRAADGHEKKNSSTTSSLSYSDYPNHSKFIKVSDSPYDWRTGQNNKLWQKVDDKSNPCPSGFRVPTIDELKKETLNQGVKNSKGMFENFLKLPLAGYRSRNNGLVNYQDSEGIIWSSSVDGKNTWILAFGDNNAGKYIRSRVTGYSVRCIKN